VADTEATAGAWDCQLKPEGVIVPVDVVVVAVS